MVVLAVYVGRKELKRTEKKKGDRTWKLSLYYYPTDVKNRRKGSSPAAFPHHQRCWQELYLLLRKPAVYGWRAVFLFEDEMMPSGTVVSWGDVLASS